MPTPAVSTLKEQVTGLVGDLTNNIETIDDLRETIDVLMKEERRRMDELLLDDEGDVTDQADESSAPLPQPEVLQLPDSDDGTISIHKQRPETVEDVQSEWSIIQAALEKNPEFMRVLKVHEDMGAKLTVVRIIEEDGKRFAEFENVANDLDIEKQEAALAAILKDQAKVDAYVRHRVSQLDQDDRENVERWIRELLQRPADVSGLNYIEADMLMWTHGAELISHQNFKEQAQGNPEIWENTWGWYQEENLAEVRSSGRARDGVRGGGGADRDWGSARNRGNRRGGRASRLRVQIA